MPHLPSQSSIVLDDDGRRLLVVNAGSDELSLFAISGDGLRLTDRVPTGGATPTSVAIRGELVYVLNNGTPNISGFRIDDGSLVALEGSVRPLSAADADPAQISFSVDDRTIVVTERGTDSISAYAIDDDGFAAGPATISSTGKTPYGFGFTAGGAMIVTEAFGGAIGAAAASSYSLTDPATLAPMSRSIGDTRSEVCWTPSASSAGPSATPATSPRSEPSTASRRPSPGSPRADATAAGGQLRRRVSDGSSDISRLPARLRMRRRRG